MRAFGPSDACEVAINFLVSCIIFLPGEGVQDRPRYIVQKSEALQQLATRARTFDRLRCLV